MRFLLCLAMLAAIPALGAPVGSPFGGSSSSLGSGTVSADKFVSTSTSGPALASSASTGNPAVQFNSGARLYFDEPTHTRYMTWDGAYIATSTTFSATVFNSTTTGTGYYLGGGNSEFSSRGVECASGSTDCNITQSQTRSVTVSTVTGAAGTGVIVGSRTADATSGVAAVPVFDAQTGIGGTPVSKFKVTGDGHLFTTYTDGSGNPGNITMNKTAGKIAVAAGASTVTVTNALVTASTNVLPTIQASDATCTQLLRAVPTAGQFVITLNSACTADTTVGFVIFN